MATINRKAQSFGTGCLVGVVGVIAIGAGFAAGGAMAVLLIAAGLALIVVGHLKSYVWYCDACGNTVRDRGVRVCPTCHAELTH